MNSSKTNQATSDLSTHLATTAEQEKLFRFSFDLQTYPLLTERQFRKMCRDKFEQKVKQIAAMPRHERAAHIPKALKLLKLAECAIELERFHRLSELHTTAAKLLKLQ